MIAYAQKPTSCAVLITEPVTGAKFKAWAQDLLDASKARLFGQIVAFPQSHAGCQEQAHCRNLLRRCTATYRSNSPNAEKAAVRRGEFHNGSDVMEPSGS
jgi:hypothetical protein